MKTRKRKHKIEKKYTRENREYEENERDPEGNTKHIRARKKKKMTKEKTREVTRVTIPTSKNVTNSSQPTNPPLLSPDLENPFKCEFNPAKDFFSFTKKKLQTFYFENKKEKRKVVRVSVHSLHRHSVCVCVVYQSLEW